MAFPLPTLHLTTSRLWYPAQTLARGRRVDVHAFLHAVLRVPASFLCYALFGVVLHSHAAPAQLPSLKIDSSQTSVSGLSSGGFMAVQFSVAYAASVKGAGIIAGGPFYCAQGSVDTATRKCSCTGLPYLSTCAVKPGSTDVPTLVESTRRMARDGLIDDPRHLAGQRIWLFSGTIDSVVPPPVMDDLHAYYRQFIPEAGIRSVKNVRAEHAMPTQAYGNDCETLGSPYLGRCGVDAAGELLGWIYGALQAPDGKAPGRTVEFDQAEFLPDRDPARHGLARSGYVRIPASCERDAAPSCRVHIAFHGCRQSADSVGDAFVRHAGYNAWADANRIVVLYPQTAAVSGRNPNACWNWFGFDSDAKTYATKQGIQMRAVKAMADRLAGKLPLASLPACFTASNTEHVRAGRATSWFLLAVAKGSGRYIGFNNPFTVTSLRRLDDGGFVPDSCS